MPGITSWSDSNVTKHLSSLVMDRANLWVSGVGGGKGGGMEGKEGQGRE